MSAHPPYMLTIAQIRYEIDYYYSLPGNGAGGILHVMLDDCNVDDWTVRDLWHRAAAAGDYNACKICCALMERSASRRKAIIP